MHLALDRSTAMLHMLLRVIVYIMGAPYIMHGMTCVTFLHIIFHQV